MWHTLRISPQADDGFADSTRELLRSTSRFLILTIGSIYLLALIATGFWPDRIATHVWSVAPVVILTWIATYRLFARHFMAAQVVWHAGLAGAITLSLYLSGVPEVAFLYALLPLMAIVTVGWPAGLLAEALIAILVWGLFPYVLARPLPLWASLGAVVGGALTGLLGWASAHSLLTVTQWSFYHFQRARESRDEVRERRAELARALKELDQAYYRLERANHALILARSEAEEAREARNRFALAVSHELRTPLNFILGFSELMVNSPGTYGALERWPPGLYEDVQEIYRSSLHLLRLVNDVLDLGQIEALQMALLKEWANPAEIVHEVTAMVQTSFARKGLDLSAEVTPGLPDVFVDRTRLRQVLLNLVSNSLRFTERGGVAMRVEQQGDDLLFCVQDTGPGIAREDIPKAFEAFRQVGSDSWRRREGAGLGIPISQRFIELHGGQMWIESEVGRGTEFYFTLPLPQGAPGIGASASAQEIDARYWDYLRERAEKERILLVLSTDPVAAEVFAQYAEGYQVIAVRDRAELLARTAELLPSALILDHTAAPASEVARLLPDLPYDLPVLSLPLPGGPGRPGGLPEGASGYLVKPVERQTLTQAVRELGDHVRHVLVVDDDPAMVRFVQRALQEATGQGNSGTEAKGHAQPGYRLSTAYTGGEALALLRQDPPDAVLLDLALPDISGWDVLLELRSHGVPTILITAHDWPQVSAVREQEALRVTMRRPLSRHELAPVLKCLLETVHPTYPALPARPARPTALSG